MGAPMHVTHAYKGQRNVLLLSTTWVTEMELSPTPLPTEPSCQSRHFSFDHCSATTNNTYSRTQMSACIPRHKCGFSLVSLGWRMNPGPRESVVFTFYKTCSVWFHLGNETVPQDGLFISPAILGTLL